LRGSEIPKEKREEFLDKLLEVEESAWPEELRADREKFKSRLEVFPEGVVAVFAGEKILGFSTAQIVDYDPDFYGTWNEITDNGAIKKTHNPQGDSLYVVSVATRKDAQGKGIGGKLVEAQKELVKKKGLARLFLGARIPGYAAYCRENGDISVEEYIELKNEKGEPLDPEIRFYKRHGLLPKKVIPNFEPDEASRDFGVVMVWENKKD
jgi:GNAT superfamily N-acetyltransferase